VIIMDASEMKIEYEGLERWNQKCKFLLEFEKLINLLEFYALFQKCGVKSHKISVLQWLLNDSSTILQLFSEKGQNPKPCFLKTPSQDLRGGLPNRS
jgi:hypothetical protein